MVQNMQIVCFPDEVEAVVPEWSKNRPEIDEHYLRGQKKKQRGRYTTILVMQVNIYFIVPIFFAAKAEAVRELFAQEITKWNGGLTYIRNKPYVASVDHSVYSQLQKGMVSGRQPSFCYDISRIGRGETGFAYYGFRSMRKWFAPNGHQIVRPVAPYDFNIGVLSRLVDKALYNE